MFHRSASHRAVPAPVPSVPWLSHRAFDMQPDGPFANAGKSVCRQQWYSCTSSIARAVYVSACFVWSGLQPASTAGMAIVGTADGRSVQYIYVVSAIHR